MRVAKSPRVRIGNSLWMWLLSIVVLAPACLTDAGAQRRSDVLVELGRPDQLESVRARLRAEPGDLMPTLLQAARAIGTANALQAGAAAKRCHIAIFDDADSAFRDGRLRIPGAIAAEELIRLLAEDPELARAFFASADPFRRSLAVFAQAGQADRFLAAMEATAQDRDPLVIEALNKGLQCSLVLDPRAMIADKDRLVRQAKGLAERSVAARGPSRCDAPGPTAAGLVPELVDGRLLPSGPSSSNGVVTVTFKRKDGSRVHIQAPCALSIYEAAAEQGKFIPELIEPVLRWGVPPPDLRRRAAELLIRDLERYPVEARNLYLARAVNAGLKVERPVRVDPNDTFAKEYLLEAVGRQGSAEAQGIIRRHVLCRGSFGGDERVALLGYLPDQASADLAYDIGLNCKDAVGNAAVALIRLGDARAPAILERALGEPFFPEALYLAIAEHPTEALFAVLEGCAGRCRENAARLLKYLRPAPREPALNPQTPAK